MEFAERLALLHRDLGIQEVCNFDQSIKKAETSVAFSPPMINQSHDVSICDSSTNSYPMENEFSEDDVIYLENISNHKKVVIPLENKDEYHKYKSPYVQALLQNCNMMK